MNKFTNNAYDFINSCIGFSKDYLISVKGDFISKNNNLNYYFYCDELKNMIITEIEIQAQEMYLIVRKKDL